MRKESFADTIADHGHVAAMQVFGVGEEAAFAERGVDEPQVVRRDPDKQRVDHVLPLVPGGDGRYAKLSHFAKQFHRDSVGRGTLLFDGHRVFVAEGLAKPLVARQAVRGAELHLVHPKRARAELFRHVHQLLVQPGDDGSDGDYSGGADEHTEDREKRPELVGAERVERQRQVFANMLTISLHGFQS